MAAIITDGLWTPPEGMNSMVRIAWIAFYSRALDVYGVTPARYWDLYRAQLGRCWICRSAKGINPMDPKGAGSRRLGIDHHHGTGQVRGLLCTGGDKTCNRIIGWLDAAQLRRAADYLDGTLTPGLVLDSTPDVDAAQDKLWFRNGVPR
jgi:hypothetical protein